MVGHVTYKLMRDVRGVSSQFVFFHPKTKNSNKNIFNVPSQREKTKLKKEPFVHTQALRNSVTPYPKLSILRICMLFPRTDKATQNSHTRKRGGYYCPTEVDKYFMNVYGLQRFHDFSGNL